MTDEAEGTWPEQNAVDAWLRKHNFVVSFATAIELKESVTAQRLEMQRSLEQRIAELEAGQQAAIDGALEEVAVALLDGRFLHEYSPPAMLAKEAAKVIRSRIGTNPLAELQAKVRELEESNRYAWDNTKVIEKSRQEEMDIRDKLQAENAELRALIRKIHNKLEYGDVYQWDDGDPCWQQMKQRAEQENEG